jgi:DNA-directed RNA polymerase subunit E'/Rpb7
MDESLFVRVIVRDVVKLPAHAITGELNKDIYQHLVEKCEGICTRHGYIRKGSIEVLKVSLGKVEMVTLNGDVSFSVQYAADICSPTIGSIVKAKIVNMNKFGLLAEAGIRSTDGVYTPILDIIIVRQMITNTSDVDLDKIRINDEVTIEILSCKYDLKDKKMSVVGRVTDSKVRNTGRENTDSMSQLNNTELRDLSDVEEATSVVSEDVEDDVGDEDKEVEKEDEEDDLESDLEVSAREEADDDEEEADEERDDDNDEGFFSDEDDGGSIPDDDGIDDDSE